MYLDIDLKVAVDANMKSNEHPLYSMEEQETTQKELQTAHADQEAGEEVRARDAIGTFHEERQLGMPPFF